MKPGADKWKAGAGMQASFRSFRQLRMGKRGSSATPTTRHVCMHT